MKIVFGLLFVCVFCVFSGFAQDTFLLLSGKKITLQKYKFDDRRNMLMYENEKGRLVEIDKDYIFSKTDKDSKEEILYSPDPDSSNHRYFSVNEMRDYIQGELDARENYKAPLATITGFIVGGTSPFVMWYGIGYPPFYSPMLPAGYTAVVGLTETSRKKIYKNNPEYKDNMFYLMGYREVSKSKRIVNVIKGSLIGLVAGITTGIIISSRDDDDE